MSEPYAVRAATPRPAAEDFLKHRGPLIDRHWYLEAVTATRFERPPGAQVHEFEVDGSLNLYRAESERAIVLNPTAAHIWRLVEHLPDVDELVEHIATTHGSAASDIRADVEATLEVLCREGLLVASE